MLCAIRLEKIRAETFLLKCEDFFWKFQTVTQNMSTYSIEEEEKQDA